MGEGCISGPAQAYPFARHQIPAEKREADRTDELMKLRKEAEVKLKGEDTEVVGYAEKAVDATTLPAGWAAAVDGDGDTYYVRSQLCHICPTAHYMLLLTA